MAGHYRHRALAWRVRDDSAALVPQKRRLPGGLRIRIGTVLALLKCYVHF